MKPDMDYIPGYATSDTAEGPCPHCGETLRATTSVAAGQHVPRPGDAGVCIYCGEILTFDELGRQVRPTQSQLIALQRSDIWPQLEKLARRARAKYDAKGKP